MAQLDVLRESKRSELKRKLRNAKARLVRAEAAIDDIESELSWLEHDDTLDIIRSWRGAPNWSLLLNTTWGGMLRYMLCDFFLERMGFGHCGTWSDTGQDVITIGVHNPLDPTTASSYVSRLRKSIEAIAGFVQPHEDGNLWFSIDGDNIEGFALTLRVSPDLLAVKIDRMHYGDVEDTEHFATLGEALFDLQQNYPVSRSRFDDYRHPTDAPGDSGEALREALTAFLDGCRRENVPPDWLDKQLIPEPA